MYHDEFAKKPAQPKPAGDDLLPSLPLEICGGLSLGFAASLNQPVSMVLFYLGGLLPLVTCSVAIAAQRALEFMTRLVSGPGTRHQSVMPIPHFAAASGPMARARVRHQSARSAR
jgi:hypothetical protein